jgi:phosphoglycerate dehydrogenase-like enzyme
VLHVAVLDDFQDVARSMGPWDRLGAAGEDLCLSVFNDHLVDVPVLAAALENADVVVAMRERTVLGAELFASLPDLKLVVTTGHSNVAIDVEAASTHDVLVCGTAAVPGRPVSPKSSSTAELTWALVLALMRNVPQEDRALREGRWQTTVGTELNGLKLGVVGLGRLGTQVAGFGRAFDMEVLAWSQNLSSDAARAAGVRAVSKHELLSSSDVVTVHLVLSERTRGLIGADELALMKSSAILVNTSRGPIVDQDALVDALNQGRLGGAGLDVFDQEPLAADHPLATAPRTVLTPHIGFVTRQTYEVWYEQVVENILAWRAGRPIRVIEMP